MGHLEVKDLPPKYICVCTYTDTIYLKKFLYIIDIAPIIFSVSCIYINL